MTSSAQKLRWSLGLALLLHAVALSSYLPRAILRISSALQDLMPPAVENVPAAAQTQQQVIPVGLPGGNFQLQTQLGSQKTRGKREKPDFSQLPKFQPQLAAQLDISASLHDASDQAARAEAAMQRMMAQAKAQSRIEEEFVADIMLADSSAIIAPRAALSVEQQQNAANAAQPTSPPRKRRRQDATPAPIESAPSTSPEISKPAKPRRKSLPPPVAPLDRPETLVPVEVYSLPPVDPLPLPALPAAREAAPQAAQFIPGVAPAPDRGPGAYSDSSSMFFSQLTAHLFRANQLALANAVRAGGRLTLDVRFYVARDGRILGAQVVRSTGNPVFDRKAEQVILDASPVPQLAFDMPQQRLELSFPVDIYR